MGQSSFIVTTSALYTWKITQSTMLEQSTLRCILTMKVLLGLIDLVYVSTKDQVADIFTKALGTEKLCKFREVLGIHELGLSLRGSVSISSSPQHDICDMWR